MTNDPEEISAAAPLKKASAYRLSWRGRQLLSKSDANFCSLLLDAQKNKGTRKKLNCYLPEEQLVVGFPTNRILPKPTGNLLSMQESWQSKHRNDREKSDALQEVGKFAKFYHTAFSYRTSLHQFSYSFPSRHNRSLYRFNSPPTPLPHTVSSPPILKLR
ncbi:hypothetical protein CEXT_673531 [Caerostris extrusa]|uniref:Uncharacterized protein n=1 Tax=Caerostris extrusa TaxID=172846 RepID=A0AAV4XRH6_CAEEX|nr:hypothetical protein CEXT_673531 [Caerostris extrusa]